MGRNPNRREFLKATAGLGTAAALPQSVLATEAPRAASKPNIILIMPDQQRADALGFMGDDVVITPHLDKLASEAMVADRCICNSPLCMPSRSSLASGQYVNVHGAWRNGVLADREGPSHIRNVRDAGYHTAVIGKTHLHRARGHTSLVSCPGNACLIDRGHFVRCQGAARQAYWEICRRGVTKAASERGRAIG